MYNSFNDLTASLTKQWTDRKFLRKHLGQERPMFKIADIDIVTNIAFWNTNRNDILYFISFIIFG